MTEKWLRGNACTCPPSKGRLLFSDSNTKGLNLQVKPTGSKSWIYRWYIGKSPKELGLGPYPEIGLSDARRRAHQAHLQRLDGLDPLKEKRKRKSKDNNRVPTFALAAEAYIKTQEPPDGDYTKLDRPGWKSLKTSGNWRSRLKTYAYPYIGNKPVNEITEEDIRDILQQPTKKSATGRSGEKTGPLSIVKHETAKCVREYIHTILTDCRRYRIGLENPAQHEFHQYLSKNKPKTTNQPALDFKQLPEFMRQLTQKRGMAARQLEFKIITGLRPGKETIEMKWSEVDFDFATWTVPAVRMKIKEEHQVPLSKQAISLLMSLPRIVDNDFVFFSTRSKTGHISPDSVLQLLNRMGQRYKITPHGMRRTLREWCGSNKYSWDLAESALAHKVGDTTSQAYLGDVYLAQRREMLQEFADYAYSFSQKENSLSLY